MTREDIMKGLGIELDSGQISLLDRYADCVLSKINLLNITAAKNKAEIWERHICDALACAPVLKKILNGKENPLIIDAGAGAGFLGISVKIAWPQARVMLVESVERKCAFMNWALSVLGLKGISVENKRAGEQNLSAKADAVIERAMGKLQDILKPCLELIAEEGGFFLAYQSREPQISADMQKTLNAHNANLYKICKYPFGTTAGKTLVIFE
ncbi:MAG: class I SAM-dependent methyltransferase, partial [Elusimicrobia bacterium]|nr:class I SAM-dependent methyltransferase [Elusimicrobiota bacterium]